MLSKLLPTPRKVLDLAVCRGITSQQIHFPVTHKWNRAVSKAEKLVGFPTSLLSLRALMNDDVTSMAAHMRKLMGSDHPILRTLKRLLYHEKNNLQVRGLIILLLARCYNHDFGTSKGDGFDEETGVLLRQRRLAEYVEMIYSAQEIHKSVLNLPADLHNDPDSEEKDDLLRLEYGNKIAILGGDYLLANACTGLADLRNTKIVEMVSSAIADFTQAQFTGDRDVLGRFIPSEENITLESWLTRNSLAVGNLMANGCRGALMIAGFDNKTQDIGHKLGMNLSLSLQAFSELQPYLEDVGFSSADVLDLSGAPVLFHLQNDPNMLKYIQGCENNTENLNFKEIYESVLAGPGIQMTQELCMTQAKEALRVIHSFQDQEAKSALIRIIDYLTSR